jgi:hypothetical protein
VQIEGFEPTRITPPDPKSGAAANYAISALNKRSIKISYFLLIQRLDLSDVYRRKRFSQIIDLKGFKVEIFV